jgi:hypothetical protein
VATRGAQTRRRRLVRVARQAAGLGVVAVLTVVLAQSTTTAAFTGSTGDTGNAVAAAVDFCSSPGPAAAPSAVDTVLYQAGANAGTNYSTNVQIGTGASNNANARTLIKFELPPRPSGCTMTSATLTMRINTASAAPAPIDVYRAGAAWDVATVTWNSWNIQPTPTAGSPVTSASLGVGGLQTWNVTTLVSALYAGPDHGFLLKDAGEGSGVSRYNLYDSMDVTTAANRPRLSVTWG